MISFEQPHQEEIKEEEPPSQAEKKLEPPAL
jgi:hypothetical protein